ncbi:TMEM143 family protein [Akkermansiaceae bacterium]|nr:TMEM143 family protein [Akkermansiaceae bacterium]MDA7888199.1 TMEM143 family protein [Akkermansiaceae bacterium]
MSETMTTDPESREAFIPYLRDDLIEMCLKDGLLSETQSESFKDFCEILTASLHFEFLQYSEAVKKHYSPFDPDRDTIQVDHDIDLDHREEELIKLFRATAERANYFEIDKEEIEKCFDAVTLIDLHTMVDLEDFDRILCYARGDIYKTATVKTLFKSKEVDVDILQRVLLLFKFKDEEYFKSSKQKQKVRKESSFEPGMVYAYFYKDVPKYDLELLFPNVRIGMNLKQKLLFAIPAIGGSIGVLIKVIPQFLILIGVILFLIGGQAWLPKIGLSEDSVSNFMPVMIAIMGIVIALGGIAFKQWGGYRKKRIQLLKDVSEQLFFRNLATNRSVFHRVIDSAEEEEVKEMLLVFYHLITSPAEKLTRETLDAKIEQWMEERFGSVIDYDIDGPLNNLAKLRGPARDVKEVALVEISPNGVLQAVPLEDAKHIIDHRWDNAFSYANETP